MENQQLQKPEQFQIPEVTSTVLQKGEAVAFEPQPFEDKIPVMDITEPIVGIVNAGTDRFYVVDTMLGNADHQPDTSKDRFAIVHARPVHAQDGKMAYMPTVEVGRLGITSGDVVVGRAVDGKKLTGASNGMSRTHAEIGWHSGMLTVKDLEATNGTSIVTMGEPEKLNSRAATQVQEQETPTGLIDSVPQSDEEVKQMREEARLEALQPQLAEIQEKIDEEEAKIKAIREPFSEEERHDMWKYAAHRLNKREAQARGDGQGSIIYGQESGQAYNRLSPEARVAADNYMVSFQRIGILREQQQRLAGQ